MKKMAGIGYKKLYSKYILFHTGKIYSLHRKRFIKPQKNPQTKYYQFTLRHNNLNRIWRLHRLLAVHFIPNPTNLPCVDHINRKRRDNRLSNLKWSSYSDNAKNRKQKGFSKHYCKKQKRWIVRWRYNSNHNLRKSKQYETEVEADIFISLNYPFPMTKE